MLFNSILHGTCTLYRKNGIKSLNIPFKINLAIVLFAHEPAH